MAIKGGEIKYSVSFDVNMQRLNQAFNDIKKLTTHDLMKINPEINLDQARTQINELWKQTSALEDAFDKAFNPKLNTVNIQTFNKSLKDSGTSLQKVYDEYKKAGSTGESAFRAMSSKLLDTNMKLKETSGLFKDIGTTLKNSIKWNIASSVINTFSGKVQEAYGYVKNLDSSLNDIRIVTGKSADEMDRFAEKANKAAQKLGKSTTDYTNASLIYYQQGLSDEETAARTDVTLKAANVTQQSTQEVSEQLTAVWNGYKVSAQEAELYVDKLAAVAAGTASDLEELSTGMSKVASAANALGVDVDQMNAILSTSISVTRQAPETIGSAYKTIFARMSTISAGGTDEEDGATLTSYTDKMSKLGINVLDANNQLRDMGDVIEEVGGKWSSFSKEQQIALAQVMAGTRQYNNLIALFDNWDKYTDALNMSANAAGTLNEQQEIYAESAKAKLQELSTAVEGIFDSLLSGKDIGKVADTLVPIANGIESVIDAVGGGTNILAMFGPALLRSFSPEISKQILTFKHNIEAITQNKAQLDNYVQTLQTLTSIKVVGGADQELQKYQSVLASMAQYMKPEEYQKMINKVNELTQSYNQQGEIIQSLQPTFDRLSQTLDKPIDASNYEKSVNDFQKAIGQIGATIDNINEKQIKIDFGKNSQKELKTISKAFESVSNDFDKFNTKIEGLTNHQKKIATVFIDMKSGVSSLGESVKNLESIMGDKAKNTLTGFRTELEGIQKDLNNGNWSQDLVNRYRTVMDALAAEIVKLQAVADESPEAAAKLAELQKVFNDTAAKTNNLNLNIQDSQIEKATQGVTQLGTSLLQLTATAITFKDSWDNIWDDDNLSSAEKFKKSLQLIAFSGISLLNMASGVGKSIKSLKGVFNTATVSATANAGANIVQAKSQEKVAKETKEATQKIKESAQADKQEGIESAKNAVENMAQAKALDAVNKASTGKKVSRVAKGVGAAASRAAQVGGAAATGAAVTEVGAASSGAAAGGASFIATLGSMVAAAAPVVLAVGALAAVLVVVAYQLRKADEEAKKYETALKNAEKAHKETQENLAKVTEEYNNLTTAIENLQDDRNTLDTMTEGTSEWKEQLKKVNEEVKTLLENFPELKKYATYVNGEWVISDEGFEKYQKELEDRKNFQTTTNYAAENAEIEAKSIVDFTNQKAFTDIVEKVANTTFLSDTEVRDILLQDLQKSKEEIDEIKDKVSRDTNNFNNAATLEEQSTERQNLWKDVEGISLFDSYFGAFDEGTYLTAEQYLELLLNFPEELKKQYLEQKDDIISDNTKAMVDTQYGRQTEEIVTNNNIADEKYKNIVAQATTTSVGLRVEQNKQNVQDTFFNEKGELQEELTDRDKKSVENFLKQYYAINKSTDEEQFKAEDVTVDLSNNKVKVGDGEEITIDWGKSGLKDVFVGQQALLNEEKSAKNFAEYYSNNMTDAIVAAVAGGSNVGSLTQEEIDAAIKAASDGTYQYNQPLVDDFNEAIESFTADFNEAKNKIITENLTTAYDKAISGKQITKDQELELINKVSEVENQFGQKSALSFLEQMQDASIDEMLKFDINTFASEISAATKKALEDAKIDENVFKNYKENYKNMGLDYDDDTIIRYIQAEDDLNKIYENRDDIFKSLANAEEDFKSGSLDQTQLGYISQMQSALSELTGFDVTAEQVVNNLDAIQSYLTGTEQGAYDLQKALANIKISEVKNTFDSFDAEVGKSAPQVIVNKVNELAEELELSNEDITLLYAQHGYIYDTNKQQYVKTTNAINIIQQEIKYEEGDKKSKESLMEELGVETEEELRALGWTPIAGTYGYMWEKTTSILNEFDMSAYMVGEDGQIYQIVQDWKDKTTEALEAEGCVNLGTDAEPQWVLPVTLETMFATKVATTGVGKYSPPVDDGSKNKVSGSEKKYKRKYENVTDFYDQVVSAKQRELKALQDAEENLTGDALTNNLNKQKELYEQIVEKQKEKLKLSEDDIKLQKEQLDKTASDVGVSIEYDDSGYVSNIGNILDTLDKDAKDKADIYDAEYKRLKDKEDNKQSISQDEIDNLEKLSKAADEAEKKLTDFKESYDNYISALGNKDKVIDDIIETQKSIDDSRISSYLAATNKELEKLSGVASDFASAMSDVNAEFNKLYGNEQSEALDEWMDYATLLSQVLEKQQETFKLGLDNLSSMATADDSGLSNTDKDWVKNEIDAIKATDDSLFDQGRYIVLLAEIENKIAEAQKKVQDLINSGAPKEAIEAAQAELSSWEALGSGIKAAQSQAKALAKSLDDIYLTAGEVEEKFSEWQISAIDTQIGLIDKQISRLQKQASKLKGQALIDNLKQQNQQIEKQIKLEKSKLKLLQAQMQIKKLLLQQSLSELAASLGTQLSLSFDNLGNITAESIAQMQKVVMASLQGAGATGAAAQQQWNALLQSMESYNAAAAAVQASMDAIEGYGDSMQDNLDSMNDALKEARNLALEIFNAKVDVEINIEDAWRQLDALKAKMDGIKENNFLAQAELSAKNIQRYLGDISNPNSYFGSGKGSIGILTDHVNDIMSEIGIMQSGGISQYYGKDEGAAFDDLMNYANQLMSQVEAYYQEVEKVRQQYSNAIDAIISKNQELLDDYDKMNQLSKHGINITKLLYGENSYEEMQSYYDNISKNTKGMLKQATEAKAYYAKEMARLAAKGETDSEAYQKMREGYEESMQQVYEYGEQLLEQYSEELMNKVNSYNQKMTDTLANLAGFADELLMNQDWEYQTKLMDDYLDATNAAYEMQALQSKFQTSIDDTDNLSSKRELTKVMNEQLDILEKQLEDGQLLTKYDIDRANKVYELTLKQIALEEAQQNKSKMRLRRDSQGNYRYEYVADQEKIEDAKQDLLKTQNDLYNLDKQRTTEMINEVKNLRVEYLQNEQAILEDAYLTKEEKEQALVDLQNKYYAEPDGLIYMAVQEYNQAKKNMEADTDEEITFYHNTMAEAMSQNWNDVAATEKATTDQILLDLEKQAAKVQEATDLMSQGYGSLEGAISADITVMEDLLLLDEQLLSQYEEQMIAIEELMEELEALEDHYKSVMDAALAAIEAALQLRQMNWEEDDGKSSTSKSSSSSGNGGTTGSGGTGGSSYVTQTAEIKVNNKNKGCISDSNGDLTKKEKTTIKQRAKDRGYSISTTMLSDKEAEKKYGKVQSAYIPFDTGGYTGQWGDEGKIAMLHEKELVLNKTDTQNILNAVSIVRNLTAGLTSLQNSLIGKISSPISNTINQTGKESTTLDQNVHIEAVFPNVSSSNEIEKAFNDLVNLASQRAMSTRK